MPRFAPTDVPEKVPDAVVASAYVYPGRDRKNRKAPRQSSWQREAWEFYDNVGELRYAANWIASVASRALLVAAKRQSDRSISRDKASNQAMQALNALFGGTKGQTQMTRAIALHLFVAGEAYVIGREWQDGDPGEKGEDVWEVAGTDEVHVAGEQWVLRYEGRPDIYLEEDDVVFRIWQPHPRNRMLADSPVRAVLPVLREIRSMDRHVNSQVVSRLLGNGMLLVPSEIQFTGTDGSPQATAQALTEVLGAQMRHAAACLDDVSAEDQVPIVISTAAENIEAVRHMTFWSELDEKAQEMRSGAVRRLALGLDIPQEIVMGTSDMNRWGAWQVEESSVKAHVEPLLEIIVTFLTVDYLQAITGDTDDLVIYDTTELRLRPNRSREAIELYDRGLLSGPTTRRETGFTESDKPDNDEIRLWILTQMVKASWSPDQAQAAAEELGVNLGLPFHDNEPREARPTPTLEKHPAHDPPEESVAVAAMVALRTMQRAGNRLRTLTGHKPEGVLAENTHCAIKVYKDRVEDLLKGGTDCGSIRLEPSVEATIEDYCRGLLSTAKPYSYDEAKRFITARMKA